MLKTTSNLNELEVGVWNTVKNAGALYFDYAFIKPEEGQVGVVYVSENADGSFSHSEDIYVVKEEIFKFDVKLAQFSLENIDIDSLLELVMEFDEEDDADYSDLVHKVTHYNDDMLKDKYPNLTELKKYAYLEPITDSSIFHEIGGKAVTKG